MYFLECSIYSVEKHTQVDEIVHIMYIRRMFLYYLNSKSGMADVAQKNLGLKIVGILLAIGAAAHLWRAVAGWNLHLSSWVIPSLVSIIGAIVAGSLSVWLFTLAKD